MKCIRKLKSPNTAQLIPSFRTTERRLLSIFMGIMDIVPSFRGHILEIVGYRGGKTSTYKSFMEPSFDLHDGPTVRPDGLMVCTRGKKEWSALLEAKSDNNKIRPEQIESYANLAKLLDVDAVITLSNEYAVEASELPYTLQRSKRKGRDVYHLSWSRVAAEMAVFLETNTELHNAERRVMMEAIRFFSTKESGISTFDQMSPMWKDFVNSANTVIGFNNNTPGVADIVRDWQQEQRDLLIKINQQIGENVETWFPAKLRKNSVERKKAIREQLTKDYELRVKYIFGRSKTNLEIVADLRACSQKFIFTFLPPTGKQIRALSTWLCRTLESQDTDHISVMLDWPGREKSTWYSASEIVSHPEAIIAGRKYNPNSISFVSTRQDARRFKSRTRFIEDVEGGALDLVELIARLELI